jgi:benzoyl-CoA reductase/2-hydroxyglutaryl-CoA dehydratase subunit BcrC/BadD/HgdB
LAQPAIPSSTIGLTSTIPVEIVFAAGLIPVDLNNVFVGSVRPEKLLTQAESAGFAPNICAWIKGIYATVINHKVKRVIAVTGGDCSNTVALAEVLARRGVEIIPFDYPPDQDRDLLMAQMEKLRRALSVTWPDIQAAKKRLDGIRTKLRELDRLTFEENVISGFENHLFLVSSSDFKSDPDQFEQELDEFLRKAEQRERRKEAVRLGFLGVPPIFNDLYDRIESLGGRVVFNEIQRQFSMPYGDEDIVEQYLHYTYPYDMRGRIEDIKKAVKERNLDGLIHYTQTFCFRQIYDIILKESISIPILTLEGDRPGGIDGRTAIRIETFIEILKSRETTQPLYDR